MITTIGRMRHCVDIAARSAALSDRGQVSQSPPLILSRGEPCEIVTLSGREFEQARQVFATATHRVRMRPNSRVRLTTAHILIFQGRSLNIGHINNVDQVDRELVVLCDEEVAK